MDLEYLLRKYTSNILDENVTELYFYTTLDTFINYILQKNEIVLLAGHVDYMEDMFEFQNGLEVIRQIGLDDAYAKNIESLKRRFPFQLSLSRAKDNYPMWKIYGKDAPSVMLILDYEKLSRDYLIKECLYDGTEEYQMIKSYLYDKSNITKSEYDMMLTLFPYLAKDSHYQYENEFRIFKEIKDKSDKSNMAYNIKGGFIKPFKKIHIPKECLKGVMLSPCTSNTFDANANSLLDLFRYNEFTHIFYQDLSGRTDGIVKSEILLRK